MDGQYIYMRPPKVIEKLGLLPEGTIWKLKKAFVWVANLSVGVWEVERDNSLAELQWEIDGSWYGLTPAKGNPCLWAVVQLQAEKGPAPKAGRQRTTSQPTRSIGVQTEGQDAPLELLGGLVTYVDDLLLAMPEVHMRPVIRLLLKKYVMKQSGCLPSGPQKQDVQIGFLGCRITRDLTGTVFCDQEKYILHCVHENSFVGESQTVTLKPRHNRPSVDEKLPDEVLPEADKRKPEIHRTTDVAGHKDKARHLGCSWHLCFHDGEDSQGSGCSFGGFVEICLVDSLLCDVHAFSRKGPGCGLFGIFG